MTVATAATAENAMATCFPSASLRDFVSHYWSSRDNLDSTYAALPDGAVDLVVAVCGATAQSWVYGTTTARADVPLERHGHYFGVRFKPGQSRHFIKTAADELTDGRQLAGELLRFSLDDLPERVADGNEAVCRIDDLLQVHLAKRQPARDRIDDVIDLIEAARGGLRIEEVAASFGKTRRHFERVFLQIVGVSPKFFSSITRFRHAAALLASPRGALLADVAAAAGYADQSHMTREFGRLAGVSPTRFLRHHVAFLQDGSLPDPETGRSSQPVRGGAK